MPITLNTHNRMFTQTLLIAFLSLAYVGQSAAEDATCIKYEDKPNAQTLNKHPDFNHQSIQLKQAAKTTLNALVTTDGSIKEMSVRTSSGHKLIDDAALEAVRKWHFKPRLNNGCADENWVVIPILYSPDTTEVASDSIRDLNQKWIIDSKGCKLFDDNVQVYATYHWRGACIDGLANDNGLVELFVNDEKIATKQGVFEKGLLTGQALATFVNGSRYEGNYETGYKSGKGKQVWLDGLQYEGDFSKGERTGKGTLVWKNGTRYEGDFIKGIRTGKGKTRWDNGVIYTGDYLNGEATGHGVMTWPNGVSYAGEFKEGRPVGDVFKGPEVVTKPKLEYPTVMLTSGNNGVVRLRADLDVDGHLSNIEVLQSHHPAFEKAAIQAFVKVKIKPATVERKPIPFKIHQQFTFEFVKGSSAVLPYEFKSNASASSASTPSFDTPPTYKVIAPLVYPVDLLKKGATGFAKASAIIDSEGKPTAVEVIEATHTDFGLATKAMLASSTFLPATQNKMPTWSKIIIKQEFARYDRDIQFDKHALRLIRELRNDKPDIYKIRELDNKPTVLFSPLPSSPMLQQEGTQKVYVEFYIDKTGGVQLPHILKANNVELGWLALTAVSRWQFEPPKVNGVPVDAVVTLPVEFNTSAN